MSFTPFDHELAARLAGLKAAAAGRRGDLIAQAVAALEQKGCQTYRAEDAGAALSHLQQLVGERPAVAYPSLADGQVAWAETLPGIACPGGPGRPALPDARERILAAEFGITGATGLAAATGSIVLAEDDGFGRAVSNLPYRHVCLVHADKLFAEPEDVLAAVEAYARFVLNKAICRYVSVISGPSKTADIAMQLVKGMHGPKHVHVVILDFAPPGGNAGLVPRAWVES